VDVKAGNWLLLFSISLGLAAFVHAAEFGAASQQMVSHTPLKLGVGVAAPDIDAEMLGVADAMQVVAGKHWKRGSRFGQPTGLQAVESRVSFGLVLVVLRCYSGRMMTQKVRGFGQMMS